MKFDTSSCKSTFKFMNEINKIDPTSQTYIVGGAVRDIIMGYIPNDFDIATNVPCSIIDQKFETFDIGKNKDFGISVVIFEGETREVANFRKDGEYSDGRHPDSVEIVDSFEEDSARRDFTINAMGMTSDGTIIDHHNGMEDIKNKVIRCVGKAEKRIAEDYIRIMRAIRFAARYDFSIDSETVEAIKKFAPDMMEKVSVERVWGEFVKMAGGKNFYKAVEMMYDFGVMKYVFPQMSDMANFPHNPKHHPEGAKVRPIN
jgi:tRNA nucleotidyltransferase (CCA-adding enzyme)